MMSAVESCTECGAEPGSPLPCPSCPPSIACPRKEGGNGEHSPSSLPSLGYAGEAVRRLRRSYGGYPDAEDVDDEDLLADGQESIASALSRRLASRKGDAVAENGQSYVRGKRRTARAFRSFDDAFYGGRRRCFTGPPMRLSSQPLNEEEPPSEGTVMDDHRVPGSSPVSTGDGHAAVSTSSSEELAVEDPPAATLAAMARASALSAPGSSPSADSPSPQPLSHYLLPSPSASQREHTPGTTNPISASTTEARRRAARRPGSASHSTPVLSPRTDTPPKSSLNVSSDAKDSLLAAASKSLRSLLRGSKIQRAKHMHHRRAHSTPVDVGALARESKMEESQGDPRRGSVPVAHNIPYVPRAKLRTKFSRKKDHHGMASHGPALDLGEEERDQPSGPFPGIPLHRTLASEESPINTGNNTPTALSPGRDEQSPGKRSSRLSIGSRMRSFPGLRRSSSRRRKLGASETSDATDDQHGSDDNDKVADEGAKASKLEVTVHSQARQIGQLRAAVAREHEIGAQWKTLFLDTFFAFKASGAPGWEVFEPYITGKLPSHGVHTPTRKVVCLSPMASDEGEPAMVVPRAAARVLGLPVVEGDASASPSSVEKRRPSSARAAMVLSDSASPRSPRSVSPVSGLTHSKSAFALTLRPRLDADMSDSGSPRKSVLVRQHLDALSSIPNGDLTRSRSTYGLSSDAASALGEPPVGHLAGSAKGGSERRPPVTRKLSRGSLIRSQSDNSMQLVVPRDVYSSGTDESPVRHISRRRRSRSGTARVLSPRWRKQSNAFKGPGIRNHPEKGSVSSDKSRERAGSFSPGLPRKAKRVNRSGSMIKMPVSGSYTPFLNQLMPQDFIRVSELTEAKLESCKRALESHYWELNIYLTERKARQARINDFLATSTMTAAEKAASKLKHQQRETAILRQKRIHLGLRDFELIQLIGRGAFGEVFLARKKDAPRDEIVALKKISKQLLVERKREESVVREREILKGTRSSWIIHLVYSFQDALNLYLCMEFAPGGDFRSLVDNVALDEKEARFYAAEMFMAVETLHSWGFTHRDLKPDNFLIDRDGHLKLTDFGLSKGDIDRKDKDASVYIPTRIYLADGTWKTLPLQTTTTAQEAVDMLAEKVLLQSSEQYALYVVESGSSRLVESSVQLHSMISSWPQGAGQDYRFVFKKVVKARTLSFRNLRAKLSGSGRSSLNLSTSSTASSHKQAARVSAVHSSSSNDSLVPTAAAVVAAAADVVAQTSAIARAKDSSNVTALRRHSAGILGITAGAHRARASRSQSPSPSHSRRESLEDATSLLGVSQEGPPTDGATSGDTDDGAVAPSESIKAAASPAITSSRSVEDTASMLGVPNRGAKAPPALVKTCVDSVRKQAATTAAVVTTPRNGWTNPLARQRREAFERMRSVARDGRSTPAHRRKRARRMMSVVGSPEYMAVEVLTGGGYAQGVDYWSIGCMLYEMMVGIPPFAGETPQDCFVNVMNHEDTLIFPSDAAMSDECKDLICGLLTVPERRLSIEAIRAHPFFVTVNWARIRDSEPPFRPDLDGPTDTSYFDVPEQPAILAKGPCSGSLMAKMDEIQVQQASPDTAHSPSTDTAERGSPVRPSSPITPTSDIRDGWAAAKSPVSPLSSVPVSPEATHSLVDSDADTGSDVDCKAKVQWDAFGQ